MNNSRFKLLITTFLSAFVAFSLSATNPEDVRIYLNPGHGSWGPNDRPMATIPYPNLSSTGRPDTCGFYESNTNLWKALKTRETLINVGVPAANIVMSRVKNGPYPYVSGADDAELYNRNLTEIAEEVDAGNFDMFFSVHSNADTDGTSTNYSLYLYRGTDASDYAAGSKAMAQAVWPLANVSVNELDPLSYSNTNIRGDISFYGSSSTRTASNGNTYTGSLAVLKHGVPGFLAEGYFHTYQPARHRALNSDYCGQEGVRYARGIMSYFGLSGETTGYIMGTVKDQSNSVSNSLYTYTAGTRAGDEYWPVMGATVNLYQNNTLIDTYTTDNNYNGVFVFEGLAPGTYTIKTVADGYAEQTETVTVTANNTTYSHIFVTSSTPPLSIDLENDGGTDYSSQITGDVVYTAQHGEYTAVLTDNSGSSMLYLVDNSTKQVQSMSLTGVSSLSAIGFTDDGKLIGCAATATTYNGSAVITFYKWDSLTGTPAAWFTSNNSGNFNNALVGETFAFSGNSTDGRLVYTAANTNGTTGTIRFVNVNITNGTAATATYSKTATDITKSAIGNKLHMRPLDNGNFILDAENTTPYELNIATSGNSSSIVHTGSNVFTTTANRGDYFLLDNSQMTVQTRQDASGNNIGIIVYNIVNNIDNPSEVTTSNTTLDAAAASYQAVHATVGTGNDPVFHLVKDKMIVKFAPTETVEPDDDTTPQGIFAYGLDLDDNGDNTYTFTFTPNVLPRSARLVFYDSNGDEVGNGITLSGVTTGENTFTFNKSELPGTTDDGDMTWGVELEGKPVTTFTKLNTDNASQWAFTRACPIVDNSPESDYFGRIYTSVWEGNSNAANGIWAYNPDWSRLNTSVFRNFYDADGTAVAPRVNYRLGIDYTGTVYMSDYGDPTSGIFLIYPDRIVNNHYSYNFFKGTRTTSGTYAGVWKNGSTEVGSSTSAVSVAGSGTATKLYMLIEDFANNKNDVAVYNLVDATSGAFRMTWNSAPSTILDVSGSGTSNCGQLHADEKGGVWISHYKKDNSTAALVYSNSAGTVVFNSSTVSSTLNGTRGGGFAVSPDNSRLAIGDTDGNIVLYDITWSGTTPSLSYVNKFTDVDVKDNTTNSGTNQQPNGIYQMSFDWGGNLVVGGKGIGIYSVPTGSDNKTVTPAKKRLTVSHTPSKVYSLANLRVCLDPGHGGFTSNDRNMQTINHALGDTTGFYESNTNLRKMFGARAALMRMGLSQNNIVMTRYRNSTAPGSNDYDIPLSERRAIADQGNFDIFVSVHSNASGDFDSNGEFSTLIENGVYGNFPLFLYRGKTGEPALKHSDEMSEAIWRRHWLTTDIDPQSRPEITIDDPYIVGDLDYYDPTINTGAGKGPEWGYNSITGHTNYGYLGVLRHSVPGLLIEGFCHQYHPAAQRALNDDYCAMMGIKIARGIMDYFDLPGESTGYIMGTVKDQSRSLEHTLYKYQPNSVDAYYPLNGATVKLYSGTTLLDTYTTDDEYNGVFMFYNLEPGTYRLVTSYSGYDDDEQTVTVTANETTYPLVYLVAETPAKGIFAYNLNSSRNADGSYNFSFTANYKSTAASIIFYDADTGAQVGQPVTIDNVQEGTANTVTLTQQQLPGTPGQTLNWAVSLTAKPITAMTRLNTDNSSTFDYTRASVVVDNSPESDWFGSVYVNDRKTRNANKSDSSNRDNGIYRYNPLWTRENSSPYTGNMAWDNNYRLAIDYHGTLYIPDYGDSHAGIYIAKPDTMSDTWQNFFAGSRAVSTGVITNSGVVTGCSSPSAFILGTGADSKLYASMEDMDYAIHLYDIGSQIDSDGNLPEKWYTAPVKINNSVLYYKSGSVNSNTYAIAESDGGIWVSQNEYTGMGYNLAALRYIAADGTSYRDFTSSLATNLDGCAGGGFALTPDESQLIIADVNGDLQFYDIDRTASLPSLTWVKSFSPDVKDTYSATANLGGQVKNGIYQLAFDHGGNLYVAGMSLGIYSIPQADNTHVTPAKAALTVLKDIIVTDITLADLVEQGDTGERYHITNTLTCVYIHNGLTLYCKDDNEYDDNNKSLQNGRINYMELRGLRSGDPDQSNWIAVNLPQALTVDQYESYINSEITGITGVLNDNVNPTITVDEMPIAGDAVTAYNPNVFIPANFVEENWSNTTFFFNRPKPMEYAEVTWAVYDGTAFYVPVNNGQQNTENLKGGFYPDFSMIPQDAGFTAEEFFTAGKSYRFKAIIRYRDAGNLPGSAPRRGTKDTPDTESVSPYYTVYPLEMDRSNGIITDITSIAADRTPVDVKYFTPAGVELREAPDSGIYIEVTVFSDGSRETRKLVK